MKCYREYLGHSGSVRSLAVSQDQRFAVTGCEDGSLRVWPRDPLAEVRAQLKDLRTEVKQLEARLSEDNDAQADEMKALQKRREEVQGRIPHLKNEEDKLKRDGYVSALRLLNDHVGLVSGCAWKEDPGKSSVTILSSSWDQTVQLFDISSCELA